VNPQIPVPLHVGIVQTGIQAVTGTGVPSSSSNQNEAVITRTPARQPKIQI